MRIIECIVDAVLWLAVASDVRSADPVIAARKRASFGMFCSLVGAALFCLLSLSLAPQTVPANNDASSIVVPFLGYVVAGLAGLACIASLTGIAFFVRNVLVVKWPERYVDLPE